ncbi:glycosyltransferase [candidate division KSB1 bacterium]|nr:MAG: glycosyltransferase [candidate division KSB1 bacterium]
MAPHQLTLSVVVISWNQCRFLQRLVEQLIAQEFDKNRFDIIVVDDGSTDGSREWLGSCDPSRVRSILGKEDRGRAASRNAGILASNRDVIVMIDGDHTINPDFLFIHAERHERERCVIVGKSDFVDHPDYRALNHYLNNGGAVKLPRNAKLPGRYFLTRNCSVPRDLLLSIGLFDESFRRWGGEDLDLGVRLEKSGVPIYGEPRALAVHHHLRPLDALLEQLYDFGVDAVPLLLSKHPQLYSEMKLDRIVARPGERVLCGRSGIFYIYRCLLCAAIYHSIRGLALLFRRRRLPRILFDYLHFRQYALGYLSALRRSG